jgi:hypothetical protein
MGLMPSTWGYNQWKMLHLMAFVYPEKPTEQRKKQMLDYLINLGPNLPCPGCAFHCSSYMAENIPQVDSREAIKKYLYDFHNAVNKRTGKRILSYEECENALKESSLNIQDWIAIKRADEIRVEDHKVIDTWKKAYADLENSTLTNSTLTNTCKDCSTGTTLSIVFGILLLLSIMVMVVLFIKKII